MDRHVADPGISAPAQERTGTAVAPSPPRTRAVRRVLKRRSYAAQRELLRSGVGPATGPGEEVDLARAGFAAPARDLPHRTMMERAFGQPLGHVKAHVGPEAAEASAAMGAEAYALGAEVAFDSATPTPETVAHEVAHVVQQSPGSRAASAGEADLEREADVAARSTVTTGSSGPLSPARHPRVRRRDATRERSMTEEDLERRAGSHGGTTDGSGAWGAQADDRGITDRANHYMWTRVALAAEAMGLTNAARHMRHYLGNTGNPLTVNVDAMLRDVPPFREAHARQLDVARRRVNDHLARMGRTDEAASFQIEGERLSDVYCRESISRDWFFAIGGFTYWYTADVTVTPLPLQVVPGQMAPSVSTAPRVRMEFRLHVFDRYNWDQGKSVTIAGITVTDEQLGRLHRVGLAREYEIHGVSSPTTVEWVFSDNTTAPGQPEVPQAEARDGGRTDPTRDRGRHFDNIRGSEGSNR